MKIIHFSHSHHNGLRFLNTASPPNSLIIAVQGKKQSSAFWTVQARLSLRLTILKGYDSKHFCYIFRTAAKDCTCWKNCWFPSTAGSSHVLHSVLPHHTEHWTCAKPPRATNYQHSARKSLPICPRKRVSTKTLLLSLTLQGSSASPTAYADNAHHQSEV